LERAALTCPAQLQLSTGGTHPKVAKYGDILGRNLLHPIRLRALPVLAKPF
jgi:hypothetical protein